MFDALNAVMLSTGITVVHKTLRLLFELYYPKASPPLPMRSSNVDIDKLSESPEPSDRLVAAILREIETREKKPLKDLKPTDIERYTAQLAKIAQDKALSEYPPRREVAEEILKSLREEYASR